MIAEIEDKIDTQVGRLVWSKETSALRDELRSLTGCQGFEPHKGNS